ncbi:MAG: hypothetical protein CMM50_00990 [Rhodospirillaceae bacterium]|nr:hypothetical protein [Rhodospirillaceae bacterium]
MRIASALVTVALLGSGDALADDVPARVLGPAQVTDGITMVIRDVRVRLWGVALPSADAQCPTESGAVDCRDAAREHLMWLTENRYILCHRQDSATDDAMLAKCSAGEGDIGSLMITEGFAVVADDVNDESYQQRQEQARTEGRGVWSQ